MIREHTNTTEISDTNNKNFAPQPELILIDFNVSRKFRDESYNKLLMLTNTGAMAFVAPEVQASSSYE